MSCGTCTLCCKVMEIKELAKPADTWCSNCDVGKGCKVYATRPGSCGEFECVWLQTQDAPEPLGPELRPDICGVVLVGGEALLQAHVDTDRPNAWREGPVGDILAKVAASNRAVAIAIGKRRIGLKGTTAIEWEQSPGGGGRG